ncbi:hypothetical protein F511_21771 [Dorcoceras hygrometricum]|uniref:Uncharacterized protein n=1 Tax=Dorcoceras hygrometricum TaxID=472368 RepID=A0A2Z7CGV5_9LAMI|nr:hypothetical protein F511_21771 [Dorcoceras hygrometricum]
MTNTPQVLVVHVLDANWYRYADPEGDAQADPADDLSLGEVMLAAGCPVVGHEMLATGFPNEWLDQTMSYQLIQTPSFAMHPRLVNYITEALVWMYCSCLLVMMSSPMTSSSMVHLDVPAGSLLMFQLVHLPLLALAAGSYRSNWFTMLQLVQLGLLLITNN